MPIIRVVKVSACVLCILITLCNWRMSEGALAFRLCGQKLVNIMKNLCNHKYVSPQAIYSPGYYSNQRQQRNGIVESCCWRQCTYSYLRSYCDETPETSSTQQPATATLANWLSRRSGEKSAQESGEGVQSMQQYLIRRGTSDVWQEKSARSASADSSRPGKTFRSLFHLLSYLSQFLSPTAPLPTTTEPTHSSPSKQ